MSLPEKLSVEVLVLDENLVGRFIHGIGCTVEEMMATATCEECKKTPIEINDVVCYYELPDNEDSVFHLCKECYAKLKANGTITA